MLSDPQKLFQDVLVLTGFGERNTQHPAALEAASEILVRRFSDLGNGVNEHVFTAHGVPCKNIEAIPHEFSSKKPHLLIGAHYDSAPGTPGADDNASAVAVMLALAERFADSPNGFRFVAFANEEPPHFYTETMGSTVFARECARRQDRIEAMICLESLGVFFDSPGSQLLPPSVTFDAIPGGFDPSVGNFIGVVGNSESMDVAQSFAAAFQGVVPAVAVDLPELELSDHLSFWHAGFRAIMLTDTALFRNQHYHLESDTPEKLDYRRMAVAADCTGDAIETWLKKL